MECFLAATEFIDWNDPEVAAAAADMARGAATAVEVARRCFEWVRDEVRHSYDFCLNPVTCAASEVLRHRTGFCYAKSHLLAALLRASGLPAALCYQRLSRDDNGLPFVLHGLVAVHLPEFGWYRIDPRGNRPGIDARFDPPVERLAFVPSLAGEGDIPGLFDAPLEPVVKALRESRTWQEVWQNLPDWEQRP